MGSVPLCSESSKNSSDAAEVTIKIGGKSQTVAITDFLKPELADKLEKKCEAADKPPLVVFDNLLKYPDYKRFAVLDFAAGLSRIHTSVGKTIQPDLLAAVLALIGARSRSGAESSGEVRGIGSRRSQVPRLPGSRVRTHPGSNERSGMQRSPCRWFGEAGQSDPHED
jgi:hypothetical protein